MVWGEGRGVENHPRCRDQGREARDEDGPVSVVPEDRGAFDPPHHHVMESLRRIEARLAGHGRE
jgi:hypothetical protein